MCRRRSGEREREKRKRKTDGRGTSSSSRRIEEHPSTVHRDPGSFLPGHHRLSLFHFASSLPSSFFLPQVDDASRRPGGPMASLLHRPERVAVGRLVTRDSPSAGRKSGETGRVAATGPDPTGRMPSRQSPYAIGRIRPRRTGGGGGTRPVSRDSSVAESIINNNNDDEGDEGDEGTTIRLSPWPIRPIRPRIGRGERGKRGRAENNNNNDNNNSNNWRDWENVARARRRSPATEFFSSAHGNRVAVREKGVASRIPVSYVSATVRLVDAVRGGA